MEEEFEEEFEEETEGLFEDGETGEDEGQEAPCPPRFTAIYTGIIDQYERPIVKHPVVIRAGFLPEERKFYCPTKDDNDGQVVGWFYEIV